MHFQQGGAYFAYWKIHHCSCTVCVIPQVILQTLLCKAEEKLKDGERILKEHESIDSTVAVSENN